MLILAIESSCDDTSVALVDCSKDSHVVISQKTISQIDIHKKYGGVVPEVAGRAHAEKIVPLIEEVLEQENKKSKKQKIKPDAIAVTAGPGLITGLLVGVEAARTLSYAWNIPLVAVNHIEGHIHSVEISNDKYQISNKIQNPKLVPSKTEGSKNHPTSYKLEPTSSILFPALALVVSGGHTELILMKNHGQYKILGSTKDDAAGECFDKVAKLLGLPYPGGPQISRLAQTGNPKAIAFPRPMLQATSYKLPANYDFSFSGLKTSALYWLRDNNIKNWTPANQTSGLNRVQSPKSKVQSPLTIADFCASLEQAIVDVLVAKTLSAALQYKPKNIILCGGVSANVKLRSTLEKEAAISCPKSKVQSPESTHCMDNAAMIAVAGYYHAIKKEFVDPKKIDANPNWRIA